MTYGLTTEGFKAKPLSVIKEEQEKILKDTFGPSINLLPSEVLGQLVGVYSERESSLWELVEAVHKSQYPKTSEGTNLDHTVSLTGLTRLGGLTSKVNLTFIGTVGTVISAGSTFTVDGDPTAQFILNSDQTITAGQNEIQTVTFDQVPDSGNFKLVYGTSQTSALAFNATSQDVEDALNLLPELSSVLVTGDFSSGFVITFQGADGLKEHALLTVADNTLLNGATSVVLTIVETQEGYPNRVIALVESTTEDEIQALAGTLTIIENPITGLDSVTNQLDATLGRKVESDEDLLIRREATLQRAGASVLGAIAARVSEVTGVSAVIGFENKTLITDIDGRPAKSFEIVAENGDEDEIAQTIWDSKAAGIESFGGVTRQVVDDDGFTHNVKFSRPSGIDIYLEVDLTTNSQFPADGLAQAENALLEHGQALGIGKDVVIYPALICALNSITGIVDVAIRIGTSAGPATDDNIAIAANEISQWDSSRTTVTKL